MTDTDTRVKVVAVDGDPESLRAIQTVLSAESSIHLVATGQTGRQALQLANSVRPDVMVLDLDMPGVNGLEAAERISRVFPAIGLVMLTSEDSPEHIKMAMRAGVKEYLSKSTDMSLLTEAILRVSQRQDRTDQASGLASVWSFYGTKGSSGTTTLAVNAASDLLTLGYRVLLMDLDVLHGDAAFYLGSKAKDRSHNLLASLDSLPAIEKDLVSASILRLPIAGHGGPVLHVIDSPGSFIPVTSKMEENLAALFEFLLTSYDYIVLDLPPGRVFDANIALALDFSERLFVVSNRDYSSLRSLLAFARVLQTTTFSMSRVSLLFNSLLLQPDFDYKDWLVQQNLGQHEQMEIPLDLISTSSALQQGQPVIITHPSSTLSLFINQLVEKTLNRPASHGKASSLWEMFKKLLRVAVAD